LNTLAEEMKSFESKIVNFPILTFFYADIGRTFLNLKSFETAIQYALAGVEVNQVDEDKEGVLTNKSVLLDTACFMEAYEQALKILDDNPDLNNPRLYKLIASKPVNASSDQMFEKLLRTKKRPKSFVYCVDKKLGAEESIIRTLMHEMGDSRATVIKYLSH
jgi:tetratricopeptide (TPR) repeat protein